MACGRPDCPCCGGMQGDDREDVMDDASRGVVQSIAAADPQYQMGPEAMPGPMMGMMDEEGPDLGMANEQNMNLMAMLKGRR